MKTCCGLTMERDGMVKGTENQNPNFWYRCKRCGNRTALNVSTVKRLEEKEQASEKI